MPMYLSIWNRASLETESNAESKQSNRRLFHIYVEIVLFEVCDPLYLINAFKGLLLKTAVLGL
jgi:hypothetical protein